MRAPCFQFPVTGKPGPNQSAEEKSQEKAGTWLEAKGQVNNLLS